MLNELLEFDATTSFFDFAFDLFGFFFGHSLFESRRHAFDQLFGFHQGRTGDVLDDFDHVQFFVAKSGQNDIEFGLLYFSGNTLTGRSHDNSTTTSGAAATTTTSSSSPMASWSTSNSLSALGSSELSTAAGADALVRLLVECQEWVAWVEWEE